jgi:pantetheine-phosphate adenylyltransferase
MTKSSPRIGLYPGTFDPVTLGHQEIIARAARVVDRLIIGVARNAGKSPLFDAKTRVRMVEREVAPLVKKGAVIEIRLFDNLLMDFAAAMKAGIIIRGLRAVSDFEYEFQMAGMNQRLDSAIETVFLMASDRHQFIASRFVKEIARLGGDVSPFVSPHVVRELKRRFAEADGRRRVIPEVRD